jgi:GntR family transcriptional regulator
MLMKPPNTPNRFSTRPLYLQLRDALAARIASGDWKPGAAIANESDLAREFGVSSGTMRKALDIMEAERLLTRRQGRGTFVNDQSADDLAIRFSNIRRSDGTRVTGRVDHNQFQLGPASAAECARLQLRPQESVYRVRRVREHDGQPFMVEEAALPAALFPSLGSQKEPSHRIVLLAQEYRILLGKAEERISIGRATPDVAKAIGVAPEAPILVLDRVVQSLDGRPVEWRLGHCNLGSCRYYLAEMN